MEEKTEVMVYSRLLKKPFDTLEELQAAEKKYHEENDEKLKLAEQKKTRAKEVEDAYLEYQKIKENAFAQIAEAEKKWVELRDKFAKDYNGYHMTYTNINGEKRVLFSDFFGDMINWFE